MPRTRTKYFYDADGHRIRNTAVVSCNGSSGLSGGMGYVYDLSGRWIMELAIDSAGPCNNEIYAGGRHLAHAGGTVNFSHSDWLGTERLRTQNVNPNAGPWVACESVASLPFGDGQVTTPLYGSGCYHDSKLHFTGKERDAATGLDNFGARFDSSSFGRFTSPDPLMASARVWDPQTWNRYSYALNNPLVLVDPTGMTEVNAEQCAKDKNCVTVNVNVIYDQNSNNGKGLTDQQKATFEKQQLQNAKDQYGNADIHLDVTYTPGSMTLNDKGNASFTGLKDGALNVIVSDQVRQAGSDWDGKNAISVIPANSTNKEDLPHEMAHHFEGNTQGSDRWLNFHEPNLTLRIFNGITDANNNFDRARMRNIDSPSGWWGLNNPLASGFNGGAAWFQKFIQPTTKPQ